ncbi:hypothetical protein HW115_01735 [Verrucomicrobiaceae bacterium N1E253]|uniref:Uncharacterized protein n=1 Tax=Oceaniferula marina TaxID=2748318 RepID=A0A851GGC4_9BACT|nr:hypothetical protein [Oceaniferula marina]NWK54315.1 hypothetical protein [Oceaniferula marina]
MTTFRTNTGHTVKAATIEEAIEKVTTDLIIATGEHAGCKMKIHSSERFTVPRHKIEAVRLVLEPDLPDFIARLIPDMPTLESPFSITDTPQEGSKYEIENPRPGFGNFIYSGEWEAIATEHAYFLAGCNTVRDNHDLNQLFIASLNIKDNLARGTIMCGNSVNGSVHVRGQKLPTK